MTETQAAEKIMFFRSDLDSIVWDDDRARRVRFNERNQFITDDPYIIKKLDRLGYPRVPLDAKVPPPIPDRLAKDIGDIKVMPKGATEDTELQRIKRESILHGKGKDDAESGSESKKGRQITRRKKKG